jgi:hypothetical protein
LAGEGTLGASYLPCCAARLAAGADWLEARARLALLWSERAAALRFRRGVIAAKSPNAEARVPLARLQREASAYDAGAARLRRLELTRTGWLVRRLHSRRADRVVGAAYSTMAADLAMLTLGIGFADGMVPSPHLVASAGAT